jgi:hypothetical protein
MHYCYALLFHSEPQNRGFDSHHGRPHLWPWASCFTSIASSFGMLEWDVKPRFCVPECLCQGKQKILWCRYYIMKCHILQIPYQTHSHVIETDSLWQLPFPPTLQIDVIYRANNVLDCHHPPFRWMTNDCLGTAFIVLHRRWCHETKYGILNIASSFSATLFWPNFSITLT